ncbi:MAG: DNA-3-methyladenine glycosylase [Gammaproteobacteria bacterium]|nr:DNA-3-methyladenine glycosylase [Gammaproteobacteria bacterium]MXW45826.1 DNA-3-methyladenine glycosylase 2 family protein [Gammaproteobacteria bacterium]MYD01104.1 DNA-3-methyladenine glycosylase 2 family protein [Gammaproteobacteria bacterium]MYI25813.1 DNA-3-methyladenine glycosylase 2 family protein [Gammaproteobacteria bacterium]
MTEPGSQIVPHWNEACEALIRADPVLAELIRAAGASILQPRNDAFYSLSRSIVAQQISVHAAEAVWQRLTAAVGAMTPSAVCGHSEEALHGCGLSRRKASYLLNLAEHFRDGALAGKSWHRMDDEQVIETLVEIRGIGRWTAEMFLIFHLLRPDVLPVTDIGIQKAVARHYNAGERLTPDELVAVAEPWRPWRSVASWYLWRSLDAIPVEY